MEEIYLGLYLKKSIKQGINIMEKRVLRKPLKF